MSERPGRISDRPGAIGLGEIGLGEIRQLTGLRGVAALVVALAHWNFPVFGWHNAAVDLFFCLSAFTLCLVYGAGTARPLAFRAYFTARIARIYPLYLFTLLLAAGAWASRPTRMGYDYPATRALGDFIRQILMVNAWPLVGTGTHWNHPSWSVSVEFLCYLAAFPLVFRASGWGLRLRPAVRGMLALLAMGASLAVFRASFDAVMLAETAYRPPLALSYWTDAIRGVAGFGAGWLAYLAYARRDALFRACARGIDLIVLALFGVVLLSVENVISDQFGILLFPFIVLGLMNGRSASSRLLASRAPHALGVISYSIYLWHMPLYLLAEPDLPALQAAHPVLLPAAGLAVLLAVSALSYLLIERPMRRLIRAGFAPFGPAAALPRPSRAALPRPSRAALPRPSRAALPRPSRATRRVAIIGIAAACIAGFEMSTFAAMLPGRARMGEELVRGGIFQGISRGGWGLVEAWGVWSVDDAARIEIDPAPGVQGNVVLEIAGHFARPAGKAPDGVAILVNGVVRAEHRGGGPADDHFTDRIAVAATGAPLRIEFRIAGPVSLRAAGYDDDRRLGIGLTSLKLLPASSRPAATAARAGL